MPKKSSAAEFNMTQVIRDILTEAPTLSSKEVADAILTKYPTAKINKGSFSVAFYTGRKKLGIGSSRRGRRVSMRKSIAAGRPTVDLATLQSTAKFLREVGGAEAAVEAIKQVQAVQLK